MALNDTSKENNETSAPLGHVYELSRTNVDTPRNRGVRETAEWLGVGWDRTRLAASFAGAASRIDQLLTDIWFGQNRIKSKFKISETSANIFYGRDFKASILT